MTAWLAIGGAGLVAYLMRVSVPLVATRHQVPVRVTGISRLLAPAVIAALLASSLRSNAGGGVSLRNLVTLGAGAIVARRTGSIPCTLASGLLVYFAAGVLS